MWSLLWKFRKAIIILSLSLALFSVWNIEQKRIIGLKKELEETKSQLVYTQQEVVNYKATLTNMEQSYNERLKVKETLVHKIQAIDKMKVIRSNGNEKISTNITDDPIFDTLNLMFPKSKSDPPTTP